MKRVSLVALALPLMLSACGGADSNVVEQPGAQSAAPESEESESEETPEAEQGQLIDFGFGQEGQYVAGAAIVENTSDHGGQTVTVQMNFLDENGDVITSEEQVESFAYAGQTVALHIFADVGRSKVASVEPTLLIEDDGIFDESEIELEPIESSSITQEYGATEAKFPITNPTDEPLQDLRVGIVCYDKSGEIVGGTSTYPELIPPSGEAIISASGINVASKPASCTAYPSPAGF